jgi:hypothetical protein
MFRAAIILASALLFSCVTPTDRVGPQAGSPEDLRTCAARGGTVDVRGGLGPRPVCVLLFPDGGRSCADSSQCAGRCLVSYENRSRRGGSVAGQCQWEQGPTFGCYAEVRGGRAGPVGCTD